MFCKHYLIGAMAFIGLGAQAQTTTSQLPETSTADSPKLYTIQNTRNSRNAQWNTSVPTLYQTADEVLDASDLFYFVSDADATASSGSIAVKIANLAADGYCASTTSFTAGGTTWYIKAHTATERGTTCTGYVIDQSSAFSGNTAWNDAGGRGANISVWTHDNIGSIWTITATTFDAYFTKIKDDKLSLAGSTKLFHGEEAFNTFSTTVNGIATPTDKASLISALTTLGNAFSQYNATTTSADNYVTIKSLGKSNYITSAKGKPTLSAESAGGTGGTRIWKVESTTDGKVKFYSPLTGKYFGYAAAVNQEYPYATSDDEAGTFTLSPVSGKENTYNIVDGHNDANHPYFHDNTAGRLLFWSDKDNVNNQWIISTPSEAELSNFNARLSLKEALADTGDSDGSLVTNSADGLPGYHYTSTTESDATKLNAQITAAENALFDANQTDDQLTAQTTTVKDLDINVEANNVDTRYYRIVCANRSAGSVITADPYNTTTDGELTNTAISYLPASETTVLKSLWQAKRSGDGYTLTHLNSGQGIPAIVQSTALLSLSDAEASYTLLPYAPKAKAWTLGYTYRGKTYYVTTMATGEGNAILGYNLPNDPGAGWKFEEVTSVPLTIGEGGYATICSPVTLQIAEADRAKLEAYYCFDDPDDDSKTMIKATAEGIIPASTGLLLKGEPGTYNVQLAPDATMANDTQNDMVGCTHADHSLTAGSFYVISNEDGVAAFRQAMYTQSKANKAYLPKKEGTAARVRYLSLFNDGNVTGIGSAEAKDGQKATKWYDLNGRPALYPAQGIYVNDKGEKYLFK